MGKFITTKPRSLALSRDEIACGIALVLLSAVLMAFGPAARAVGVGTLALVAVIAISRWRHKPPQ